MSVESHLTERQFFTLSLVGIGILVAGVYMGLLRPLLVERNNLRSQIETKTTQLERSGYLMGEARLLQQKREYEERYQLTVDEWETATEQLASFDNQSQWQTIDVAKIDYKYYLYLTRLRLRKKARGQDIEVPALLGLQDNVDTNDTARELMLQLLAVEKLVDTSIEYGIADIRSIDPLDPIEHRVIEDGDVYMEEFPMKVIFEGDMKRLYRLWDAMFQPGRAFMLRNVAMAKTNLNKPDEVRMTATLSSFLFLQKAEDIQTLRSNPSEKTAARGH